MIHSLYSRKSYEPEELIRADLRIEGERSARLAALVGPGESLAPEALAAAKRAVEKELPYNCKHVVPQSSFGEDEPMRGDLHHLFACESKCTIFRGNIPGRKADVRGHHLRTDDPHRSPHPHLPHAAARAHPEPDADLCR